MRKHKRDFAAEAENQTYTVRAYDMRDAIGNEEFGRLELTLEPNTILNGYIETVDRGYVFDTPSTCDLYQMIDQSFTGYKVAFNGPDGKGGVNWQWVKR